jgi:hypothetical protein
LAVIRRLLYSNISEPSDLSTSLSYFCRYWGEPEFGSDLDSSASDDGGFVVVRLDVVTREIDR